MILGGESGEEGSARAKGGREKAEAGREDNSEDGTGGGGEMWGFALKMMGRDDCGWEKGEMEAEAVRAGDIAEAGEDDGAVASWTHGASEGKVACISPSHTTASALPLLLLCSSVSLWRGRVEVEGERG